MTVRWCAAVIVLWAGWPARADAQISEFTSSVDPGEVCRTGTFTLSWTAGPAEQVELQESDDRSFQSPRTIYVGTDHSTVISGRTDGDYRYRIRPVGGAWRGPLDVRVRHHAAARVWGFLIVGASVFVATATLVCCGHLAHRAQGGPA